MKTTGYSKDVILVAIKNKDGNIASIDDVFPFGNMVKAKETLKELRVHNRHKVLQVLKSGKVYKSGNVEITRKQIERSNWTSKKRSSNEC